MYKYAFNTAASVAMFSVISFGMAFAARKGWDLAGSTKMKATVTKLRSVS